MNLAGDISYNGWSNSLNRVAGGGPLDGYIVEDVRPSNVEAVGYLEKRALQDGLDASDVFLGARRLDIDIAVYGSTKGSYWDNADALIAAFHPTLAYDADTAALGFVPLDFQQPTVDTSTWTDGYIPLRYYLRPLAPPTFAIPRDGTGGRNGNGVSGTFTANLIARDPRKYLQSEISTTVTTASQVATYRGNYRSFPIITFSLTATGHSALKFTTSNFSVQMDMSGETTGSFTLDYARKTLTESGTDMTHLLTFTAFATVEAGSTYFIVNRNGVSSPLLTYREAWA